MPRTITTAGVRRWQAGGLALLTALALSSCGLTGPARSVEAYCQTFQDEGEAFHAYVASGQSSGDIIEQLMNVMGASQQLAIAFGKLDKVAPDDIEPDVAVLQKTFQDMSDRQADNVGDPKAMAIEAIRVAATAGPSWRRVDAYTSKNCKQRS